MNRKNRAGILLLAGGIAIGIALTMLSMHAVSRSTQTAHDGTAKLIAEQAAQSPPGAADAQTPQADVAPEAQQAETPQSEPAAASSEAPAAPADWLKPQDVAAQNANGAAPSAVPAAPKYQSSNTEFYMYPTGPTGLVSSPTDMPTVVNGDPVSVGGGGKAVDYPQTGPVPWTVGANGLMQNPCVDPPSTRGRAYSQYGH